MEEQRAVIQVGIKALRKPNGEFEEAMPIYMPTTPELAEREKSVIASLEVVEAQYLKDYIEKRDKVAARADAEGIETDAVLPWWQR